MSQHPKSLHRIIESRLLPCFVELTCVEALGFRSKIRDLVARWECPQICMGMAAWPQNRFEGQLRFK